MIPYVVKVTCVRRLLRNDAELCQSILRTFIQPSSRTHLILLTCSSPSAILQIALVYKAWTERLMNPGHSSREDRRTSKPAEDGCRSRHVSMVWHHRVSPASGEVHFILGRGVYVRPSINFRNSQTNMPSISAVCDHVSFAQDMIPAMSRINVTWGCADMRTTTIGASISVQLLATSRLATLLQLPVPLDQYLAKLSRLTNLKDCTHVL
jgi:hypothetical protein